MAIKAHATSEDIIEDSGTALSHRVVLSTIMRRCVKPWEGGRGPTRSMLMWLNLLAGMENQVGLGVAVQFSALAVHAGVSQGPYAFLEVMPDKAATSL